MARLTAGLFARAIDLLFDCAQRHHLQLTADEAQDIASLMTSERMPDRAVVHFGKVGGTPARLMLILHGEAIVQLRLASDTPQALSTSQPEGTFFGLICTLGQKPGVLQMRPCGPVLVASLSRAAIHQLTAVAPAAAAKLALMLSAELASASAMYLGRLAVLDQLARGMQTELMDVAVQAILKDISLPCPSKSPNQETSAEGVSRSAMAQ